MLATTRNFCIIAHIDHGKSTLADRLLEVTGTVAARDMKAQLLDQMDLERERGITIKLQPVRMEYQGHVLNLIDTPGHVDFGYEVSRSLAAVEGALLIVDASQGVQAQTLAVLYQALEQDLTIIPVINKIDLPHAEPERCAQEVVTLLGCHPDEIIFASGKTGEGVPAILDRIIEKVPAPTGNLETPPRALVFDCAYDTFRGVVAYVRVVDGRFQRGQRYLLIQGKRETDVNEVGYFLPQRQESAALETGEIGYLITGLKEVGDVGIGDTVTIAGSVPAAALPGYRMVTPMVFASIYPTEGDGYTQLRDALAKLKLNDAALQYVPEHSPALGHGFRCGFLGMLHLEIVTERLQREYQVDAIATVPSVAYRVTLTTGEEREVHNPAELPDPTRIEAMAEPWVNLEIVTPQAYVGSVMELCQQHRAIYERTHFLDTERAVLTYQAPLSEIIVNFHDSLKSQSSGYASMSYDLTGFRPAKLVKVDILVAGNPVEALATIVPQVTMESFARQIVERLRALIPRHNFEIAIQASVHGKVVARETLSAFKKDVTAKLYGGDVTRKNKLIEKQKKGKERLKRFGKVDIPSSVFVDILKRG